MNLGAYKTAKIILGVIALNLGWLLNNSNLLLFPNFLE